MRPGRDAWKRPWTSISTTRTSRSQTRIGEPLARLESRIVIERLLARTTRVALDAERPPVRRRSVFLRRHASLHVAVTPAG